MLAGQINMLQLEKKPTRKTTRTHRKDVDSACPFNFVCCVTLCTGCFSRHLTQFIRNDVHILVSRIVHYEALFNKSINWALGASIFLHAQSSSESANDLCTACKLWLPKWCRLLPLSKFSGLRSILCLRGWNFTLLLLELCSFGRIWRFEIFVKYSKKISHLRILTIRVEGRIQ